MARTPNDIEYLISQISLGDREAFSQLYDATSAKLLGVCLRVLNERANAEEAMQDTFIKVWKNADRYSINGLSPMTWLITIARNTAIDRLRAQKPVSDINDYSDSLASKLPSPESNVAHSSDMKRVSECLEELGDDRGAAIQGAYLDGQSYAELSELYKVPLNTMRTWLRRGLLSLRECMDR
ncbi:MAG: sigma-70 family RNA polymerase sigma factor [Hyphomicrobiales bacterium]